ncbi:MAG: glycosyltransferase family 2 protein [Planctomyces sp.]|nr:glycosyltransferase family 2 protein [Planctomyces sp.]
MKISLVIPTYGREEVLVDSIRALLPQLESDELIVVDQTPRHEPATEQALSAWQSSSAIRWIRRDQPSIAQAMNAGLLASEGEVVLFLDDDIRPGSGLVSAHREAHREFPEAWGVVGQVLQPGEHPGRRAAWTSDETLRGDLGFPFWSDERAWISNVMAGNLSVKRKRALEIGGFDENFSGSAYRFETEFARRIVRAGGRILFEPAARIDHLRAERGGTRAKGSHLTSASGRHGMGDYYFALRHGRPLEAARYILKRPFREVATRFHLRHPWYIPVKLVGELRALLSACVAASRPPRLIPSNSEGGTRGIERSADREDASVTAAGH